MTARPIVRSVRPRFANQIIAGTKTHELWKTPIASGTDVLVYRSRAADQRGIVGWFTAGECTSGTPVDHMAVLSSEEAGLSLYDLVDYAGGPTRVMYRVAILSFVPLLPVAPLSVLGITSSPQAWCYAPEDWAARLGVAAGAR